MFLKIPLCIHQGLWIPGYLEVLSTCAVHSVTKKPPSLFISVFCVRCFLSFIASSTFCSHKRLLKPMQSQVLGTNSPTASQPHCSGRRGVSGEAPPARCVPCLRGHPCAPHRAEHLWKTQGSAS